MSSSTALDGMVEAMRRERDDDPRAAPPARQSRPQARAAEQPRNTTAPPRSCTAAHGRGGRRLQQDCSRASIAGKTGRHNYTEWDQVLMGAGAAHPAMNPYNMPANAECRRTYSKDMCARSLEILNRTVMVPTHPLHAGAGHRRHRPQHRRRGARRARRHAARRGRPPQTPRRSIRRSSTSRSMRECKDGMIGASSR